jgi:aminocarboxymuconate-semialdehyde decarboxylase
MPIVDIHTHVYPPKYMELLRSRSTVPYVRTFPEAPDSARLIILPGEDDPSTPSTSRGRPIGTEYYEIKEKIAFMDLHKIDKSVISLANPWLDFLPAEEAGEAAKSINDDVNGQCSQYPGRLYFFGTLPLSASTEVITAEIERLSTLKYARGVIMGTSGLGQGLDDANLDPIYTALEKYQQLIFLHPHYGLPASVYGPRASEYGHVLPLALGFPLETTIAVTRMLLSGVWDRFTKLSVLLAHSGGTLPFLAGRIESCILHDGHLKKHGKTEKRRDVWDILKTNIYLDAVIYSEVGLKAALDASGSDRLLFGTCMRRFWGISRINMKQVPITHSSHRWKKTPRSGTASMRTTELSQRRSLMMTRKRRTYSVVMRCGSCGLNDSIKTRVVFPGSVPFSLLLSALTL